MKKLKFDKEQLRFTEEITTIWDHLKKVVWLLVASLGLALVYYLIFALFINSEEEKRMIRENKAIEAEYYKLDEKMNQLENVISNLQARDREIYREIFNSDPPYFINDYQDTVFSFQGDTTDGSRLIEYTSHRLSSIESEMTYYSGMISDIKENINSGKGYKNIPSIIPVANFSLVQTGATTGRKVHPFYKTIVMHTGLDLVTSTGTEVFASADGKVSDVQKSQKGSGNKITIDHGNGYVTTYSHLGDMLVRDGQKVKRGKIIGRVGTSGTTFAPHLHYEVMLNGKYMDPVNYFFTELGPSIYKEMMIIAINTGQSLD